MLIKIIGAQTKDGELELVGQLGDRRSVYADLKKAAFVFQFGENKKLAIFGEVFYYIQPNGSVKMLDGSSAEYLKKVFSSNKLKDVIPRLEGQYFGLLYDSLRKTAMIFSDRYVRLDLFYASQGDSMYLDTDMDDIFRQVKPVYDEKIIAHLFSVYGWYAPKGLTIYKNVSRLKVGEIIEVSGKGINSEIIEFKPREIKEYGEKELETYFNTLRNSVIARANKNGKTWVSSSSGWDSSMLLGMLVNEFGSKKVGMVTGSMKYSYATDVINKFEMDKIKAIGKFYGIKPVIADLDFRSKSAPDDWKNVIPFFRSKHNYTFINYSFAKISGRLMDAGGENQVIFNGETSDSFHNFGFSQFGTFFHSKKPFTEYADKMNCYLYGPSFFKKVLDGTCEKDRVFQIFKKMSGEDGFSQVPKDRSARIESYLFPLFYGGPRIPFARSFANPAFTALGEKAIYGFPYRQYSPEIVELISPENMYSCMIHLYHSFHSQGSTVNVQKYAMEMNGHRWRSPFNDYRMIDLLSCAPENWGRGLELNNTKYPLKWVAKNKIRFPYELLDKGPHSYLYDVIEGFSLVAEIVYRSGVTAMFKDSLKSRQYRDIIAGEYIDLDYLDKITGDYLGGKEVRGADFNNLLTLLSLTTIGWY